MSLRLKLFLIFGGLIGVLILGQWLMVRALTRDVFGKLGEVRGHGRQGHGLGFCF